MEINIFQHFPPAPVIAVFESSRLLRFLPLPRLPLRLLFLYPLFPLATPELNDRLLRRRTFARPVQFRLGAGENDLLAGVEERLL